MFSFLNAYSGYSQIHMNPKDEENTTFVTRKGVRYFKAMPFGLKNAEATYQRLVTKLFEGMGGIVKAYIDDTVVQSLDFSNHLDQFELVVQFLQHQVKSNPT